MITPYYATLITAEVAGSAYNGTSAATVLPGQAVYTLPAGFIQFPGQCLRVRAAGQMTTSSTAPTLIWQVEFGGSVAVFTSQAMTLVASQTAVSWVLDVTLIARAVGSGTSANFMGMGTFTAGPGVANGVIMIPASSPVVGTGFNSTTSQSVDLWATWSSATTNTLTLQQYQLDACL